MWRWVVAVCVVLILLVWGWGVRCGVPVQAAEGCPWCAHYVPTRTPVAFVSPLAVPEVALSRRVFVPFVMRGE